MDPERFDTRSLPASQQFEAWNQWYGPVFDTTPRRPVSEGYAARNLTWRLDGFALSRVSAPAIDGVRSKSNIRRNPVDHWVITLTTRGTHRVATRGIVADPPVGVPFVQSLADTMESERSDYDRVQLYLARDDFGDISSLLDASRGAALDSPSGKLLGEYLLLLEQSLPTLGRAEVLKLRGAVKAMVAACISPSPDRLAEARGQASLSRMEAVSRAIGQHLHVSTLGTQMLCAELGMSRSQLYRLLEGEGGVAHYIQRKRLTAAYAALSDLANTRSISEIAFDLCFSDVSTFSRAFRREFGITASDVRAAFQAGQTPAVTTNNPRATETGTFGDWLRNL